MFTHGWLRMKSMSITFSGNIICGPRNVDNAIMTSETVPINDCQLYIKVTPECSIVTFVVLQLASPCDVARLPCQITVVYSS